MIFFLDFKINVPELFCILENFSIGSNYRRWKNITATNFNFLRVVGPLNHKCVFTCLRILLFSFNTILKENLMSLVNPHHHGRFLVQDILGRWDGAFRRVGSPSLSIFHYLFYFFVKIVIKHYFYFRLVIDLFISAF